MLLTQPDAVDLIRFEKNLLQIGFFGAHERRGKRLTSSRRIEQWVNRDGKKIRVSAEFRSSEVLGLPSTADRDKYMGFMKLLMEMKLRTGLITNPIRFSGYSLLRVVNASLGEYHLPTNSDVPDLDISFVEHPNLLLSAASTSRSGCNRPSRASPSAGA